MEMLQLNAEQQATIADLSRQLKAAQTSSGASLRASTLRSTQSLGPRKGTPGKHPTLDTSGRVIAVPPSQQPQARCEVAVLVALVLGCVAGGWTWAVEPAGCSRFSLAAKSCFSTHPPTITKRGKLSSLAMYIVCIRPKLTACSPAGAAQAQRAGHWTACCVPQRPGVQLSACRSPRSA